jgi:hypothetical protein
MNFHLEFIKSHTKNESVEVLVTTDKVQSVGTNEVVLEPKTEAMGKIDKNNKTAEDRQNEKELREGSRALGTIKKLNPKINKSNLNTLGMSSHRIGKMGKGQVTYQERIVDIDSGRTEVVKRITSAPRGIINFRELDYLRSSDEIDMVMMSEVDYTTQLIYGLPRKDIPKRVMNTGRNIFLDPMTFVKLVKLQRDQEKVNLVVSFERKGTTKFDGTLRVIVANPNNPNHDRAGSARDSDDQWRERESRFIGGRGSRKL